MSDTSMPNPGMTTPDRSNASSGLTNADLAPVVHGLVTTTEQLKSTSAQLTALAQQIQATTPINVVAAMSVGSLEDPGDFEVRAANAESSLNAATNALKQAQNLGFVDFTVGLINGTFDAVIGATVRQMQAYTDMVQQLAQLSYYVAPYYATVFPNIKVDAIAQQSDLRKLKEDWEVDLTTFQEGGKYNSNHLELIQKKVLLPYVKQGQKAQQSDLDTLKSDLGLADTALPAVDAAYTETHLTNIKAAIDKKRPANQAQYDLLQLVKLGMARIVIDSGEIHTKLTFNVAVDSQKTVDKTNENKNTNDATLALKGKSPWLKGSLDVKNTNINVRAVNEKSFDKVTMNAEMLGEVTLRFSTQTFKDFDLPASANGAALPAGKQ